MRTPRLSMSACAARSAPTSPRGEILCGALKVPTLRNVATRQVFFHNGLFKTLRDAVHFYGHRNTHPEEFYPRDADGTLTKFADLPCELQRTSTPRRVRTSGAP